MIDDNRGGRIINSSSIAESFAGMNDTSYTMALAKIEGVTRALAAQLESGGTAVDAIAPGFSERGPTPPVPTTRRHRVAEYPNTAGQMERAERARACDIVSGVASCFLHYWPCACR